MPTPIYFDHHATTPVDPRVAAAVVHTMTTAFGNANSTEHAFGEEAAELVTQARLEVARLVDADALGVHFTSGASESIRLALSHMMHEYSKRPMRIAISTVEHRAVLDVVADYERKGQAEVHWLPVNKEAQIDLNELRRLCQAGVDLVCMMAANNEVGTIYPIEQVTQIARENRTKILIDGTQAAGRIPLLHNTWGITYLAISAHKMYGPKGIGALIVPSHIKVRDNHSPTPGTGDGTPNVPGIVGLGEACRLRQLEMAIDEVEITVKRDKLENNLQAGIKELVINGDHKHRLSHNLHISVPGVPNDVVIARLRRKVALSSGAACMSGAQSGSHVLRAMGLSTSLQEGALRIGIGKFTTEDEIERASEYIVSAINITRNALQILNR